MSHRHLIIAATLAALIAGPGARAAENHVKGARPLHISQGQPVTLADYFVPGKTTIFDFYSEYCPDCRAVAPQLDKLHASRADLAVVEVDINRPDVKRIDWQSPVARQYDLRSIPYFKIFGPDGKLELEGDGADPKVLARLK